jgi:hypothetical protein
MNFDELIRTTMWDDRPIHIIMRETEREAGYRVVVPGGEPWLPVTDWHSTSVVSIDEKRKLARFVAILAKNPGTGAFRRAVAAVYKAGLTPCVVEPSIELERTLKRWGWAYRVVGSGIERHTQWLPRKKGTR